MLVARHLLAAAASSVLVFSLYACVGDDPVASPDGSDGGASSSSGGSSGTPADDAATCAAPKTTCGTSCVDLESDDAHCGACDNACPGTSCFNGVCDGARVKQVATGSTVSCAVRVDGSVWCWGRGEFAALGQRFEGSAGVPCAGAGARCSEKPLRVPNIGAVESISVGHQAACAVTKTQEIWCWGRNRGGELGALAGSQTCDGQTCLEKPSKVDGLPAGMTSVSLGLSHACGRTAAGAVWCWGDNGFGRLGRGDLNPAAAPAVVKDLPLASQVTVGGDQYGHTCALVGSAVWCWGYNEHLSLGRPNTSDPDCGGGLRCNPNAAATTTTAAITGPVAAVVAGAAHTCTLNQAGQVHCWGYHGYKAGSIGASASATPRQVVTDVKAIGGRYAHACALKKDGTVGCWGHSGGARLGFIENPATGACVSGASWTCNDGAPQTIAVQQGASLDALDAALVLREDGKVMAWGPNQNGQMGVVPANGPKSCPDFGGATSSPCADAPLEIVFP